MWSLGAKEQLGNSTSTFTPSAAPPANSTWSHTHTRLANRQPDARMGADVKSRRAQSVRATQREPGGGER